MVLSTLHSTSECITILFGKSGRRLIRIKEVGSLAKTLVNAFRFNVYCFFTGTSDSESEDAGPELPITTAAETANLSICTEMDIADESEGHQSSGSSCEGDFSLATAVYMYALGNLCSVLTHASCYASRSHCGYLYYRIGCTLSVCYFESSSIRVSLLVWDQYSPGTSTGPTL